MLSEPVPELPPPDRDPWPGPDRAASYFNPGGIGPWVRSPSASPSSVVVIDPAESAAAADESILGARNGRLTRAGTVLLLLAAVASPWNGIKLGGLQPGDGLLALGLSFLLISAARQRRSLALPWWLSVLAAVAALTAISQVFLPVARAYVAQRFVLVAYGGGGPDQPGDNLVNLMHWEVALLALPLAAVLTARVVKDFAHKLATAWLIGCTLSALVALTDAFRLTSISPSLLPFTDISGRQAGLTSQPNNVAVAAAMALPVAVYWACGLGRRGTGSGTGDGDPALSPMSRHASGPSAGPSPVAGLRPGGAPAGDCRLTGGNSLAPRKPGTGRAGRLFGLACIAVLLGGTFVAGSRGGSGAAGLALLVSLAAVPAGRRLMPKLILAAMITSPLLAWMLTSSWGSLQQSLRLGGAASAGVLQSDNGRALLARQAWQDFDHAPLRGIGLWVITESHSIYLQLLAAGGIALLLAFVLFLVMATRAGLLFRRATGDVFGTLTTISLLVWAVVGAVENQLTDRYLYLPAACAACLAVTLADRASAEAADLAAELDPAPRPGSAARAGRPRAGRPEYIILP